jgi:hypothetical protein
MRSGGRWAKLCRPLTALEMVARAHYRCEDGAHGDATQGVGVHHVWDGRP